MLEPGPLQQHVKDLQTNDEHVRQEAIRCLKSYTEQEWSAATAELIRPVVKTLGQFLPGARETNGVKLPPLLRQGIITVLGNIGARAEPTVPQLVPLLDKEVSCNLREAAVTALGKIGRGAKPAVEKLVAVLGPECPLALASRVARALGDIGCAEAKVKHALVNLWLIPFQCPQSRVQVAIAMCKLKIDARGLLATLTTTLVINPNAGLRKAAAEALCWCRKTDVDVVPALTAALCDADEEVKRVAELALERLHLSPTKALQLCGKQLSQSVHAETALSKSGPPAVPALVAALKSEEALAREKAARTLGLIGEAALPAAPALTLTLKDKQKEVRLAAAKALWNIAKDASSVVPVLTALLRAPWPSTPDASEPRRRFVQTVIEALGRIGPPAQAAVPALMATAKDDNRLIRESALRALRDVGPVSAATAAV
jgi:HEAT repeat protein